ncbi:hypothetical protein COOONC_01976 [Cooperia oncophora]
MYSSLTICMAYGGSLRPTSYNDGLHLGVLTYHCSDSTRFLGFTSLEAAKLLGNCKRHYDMAAEHAQRAIRLLEDGFIAHIQALYFLATVHFHLHQWEQVLADIDEIWMVIMKNGSKLVVP